jgi:hypothetical protein
VGLGFTSGQATDITYPHLPLTTPETGTSSTAATTQTRCFPSRCRTAASRSHTLLDQYLEGPRFMRPAAGETPLEAGESPWCRHVFQLTPFQITKPQSESSAALECDGRTGQLCWMDRRARSQHCSLVRRAGAPRCRQRPNRPQADMAPIGERTEVGGGGGDGFPIWGSRRTRGQPDGAGPALPKDSINSQTARGSRPRAPAHQPLGSLAPTPLCLPWACGLGYLGEGTLTACLVGRRSCP